MPKYHRSASASDGSGHRFADAEIQSLFAQADQSAADALATIAHQSDSRRAKEARRALYLLGQRGVRPAVHREPSVPRPNEEPRRGVLDVAAISMLDPHGDRILAFAESRDSTPATVILVDYRDTVTRVTTTAQSVDHLANRKTTVKTEPIPFAAIVPTDYVRHRLYEAVETTRRRGALVPIGLTDALRRIGEPMRTYASHPAYEVLGHPDATWPGVGPQDPVRGAVVATLVAIADPHAALRLVDRVRTALSSPVLLTPAQAREIVERIYADNVPELFPDDLKFEVPRWLRDDALVWHHSGHHASARKCMSLAEECSDGSAGLQKMLAYTAKVIVSLAVMPDQQPERKEASSPIVTLDDLSDDRTEAPDNNEPLIWRPGRP